MAAPILIEYPLVNSIKFVQNGVFPDLTYQELPFENDWYIHQIKAYDERRIYKMPMQFEDQQYVQVNYSYDRPLELVLLDCNQKQIGFWEPIEINPYSGHMLTDPTDGTLYQAYTQTFQFKLSDLTTDAGTYYMIIRDAAAPDFVYLLSEPIKAARLIWGTQLIEYWDTLNRQNVFFNLALFTDIKVVFGLRVKSAIQGIDIVPKSVAVSYEDELVDLTPLSDTPYNQWLYRVMQLPPYMLDKINRALSCDTVKIANVQYTKEKDAQWNMQLTNRSPLITAANILLRKSINNDTLTFLTTNDNCVSMGWTQTIPDYEGSATVTWDLNEITGFDLSFDVEVFLVNDDIFRYSYDNTTGIFTASFKNPITEHASNPDSVIIIHITQFGCPYQNFGLFAQYAPEFSGMVIYPAPEFNTIDNGNMYGADRSVVLMRIDPTASGLDIPSIVYSNWNPTGSDGAPISLVQNSPDNFYQRGATAFEDGHTTISCLGVKLTDTYGNMASTGLVVDFAISPPWSTNESINLAGQVANSNFVDFSASATGSTSIKVDILNPAFAGGTFDVGFDPSTFISTGNNGLSTINMIGLTADTEYAVYVRCVKSGANDALMGPLKIKTDP